MSAAREKYLRTISPKLNAKNAQPDAFVIPTSAPTRNLAWSEHGLEINAVRHSDG